MAKRGGGSVTKARGKSGGGGGRTPTIAAVAVLVILAVVVFGGILLRGGNGNQNTGQAPGAPIPVSPVQASYTTTLQGNVVVAGRGPKQIDVYEDAQCPACQQFESMYGQQITDALNANKITVRYHMVNLLDRSSNPPGYSSLGGNAIMCAAQNNAFPAIHKSLYDNQPPENGSGLTTQQLVDLGQAAKAGPGYASCVQNGTHKQGVAENFAQAQENPALQTTSGGSSGFATPTIVVGGKKVEPGTPELDQALA